MPHVFPVSCVCVTVADQKPAPTAITGTPTPVDCWKLIAVRLAEYLDESEKKASSAVTMLRRSDFMAVMYAFDLVLANFGIAIAAKMPMMTTTINSSMSVKPVRFCFIESP